MPTKQLIWKKKKKKFEQIIHYNHYAAYIQGWVDQI